MGYGWWRDASTPRGERGMPNTMFGYFENGKATVVYSILKFNAQHDFIYLISLKNSLRRRAEQHIHELQQQEATVCKLLVPFSRFIPTLVYSTVSHICFYYDLAELLENVQTIRTAVSFGSDSHQAVTPI